MGMMNKFIAASLAAFTVGATAYKSTETTAAADLNHKPPADAKVFTPAEITQMQTQNFVQDDTMIYFLNSSGINIAQRVGFALGFRDQKISINTINNFGIKMTPGCLPCDGTDYSGDGAHISSTEVKKLASAKLLAAIGTGVFEGFTDTGLRYGMTANGIDPKSVSALFARGVVNGGLNVLATRLFGGKTTTFSSLTTNYSAGNNGFWNNYSQFPNADGEHYTAGDKLYSTTVNGKKVQGPKALEYALSAAVGFVAPAASETLTGLEVGPVRVGGQQVTGVRYSTTFDIK